MNVDEFRVYLKVRGYDRDTVDSYVNGVEKAQGYFGDRPVGEVDVDGFKEYVAHLLEKGENTEGNLVGLARYVYSSDMKDQWIYFAAILGGREV
ncbi:hypothetical protein HOB36_07205, partial [Candidatus Bathyarchaeota archaeon]|nr:hypothetical protein [Candidatus Bathyarchaeota archaeon]